MMDIYTSGDWSERHAFDSAFRAAAGNARAPALPACPPAPARAHRSTPRRALCRGAGPVGGQGLREAQHRGAARAHPPGAVRCPRPAAAADRVRAPTVWTPPHQQSPPPLPRSLLPPLLQVETSGFMDDEQPEEEEEEEEERTPKKGAWPRARPLLRLCARARC